MVPNRKTAASTVFALGEIMTTCDDARDQALAASAPYTNWVDHATEADYPVTVAFWQAQVACNGYYSGPCDGAWGINSRKGVQQYVKTYYGYTGPVDGAWGTNTWKGIQRMAADQGGYTGPIDGAPGPNTWRGIYFTVVAQD